MLEYDGDLHFACLEAEALAKQLYRFKVFFIAL